MGERGTSGTLLVGLMVVALLAGSPSTPEVTFVGGTPQHLEMGRWAVQRYAAAGLTLPELEIRFHDDPADCGDRMGSYRHGVVDLCYRHLDGLASRTLVHEMAHGWLEAGLSAEARERFLGLRTLPTWNDPDRDWDERGFEQAAETIAWAVGDQADGIRAPSFPDNARWQLEQAYEVLTGRTLPVLAPDALWVGIDDEG